MRIYRRRRRASREPLLAVEEEAQRDAARNGRKAEALLANYIQGHEDSTKWLVNEIDECPYERTGAKHRAGLEKPDVVIYDLKSGREFAMISLKCCVDFRTGFNQIKRSSLKNFRKEFALPDNISALLTRYTVKRKKFLTKGKNYTNEELEGLKSYLSLNRKALMLSAFTGQAQKSKANWLLLHQWTPPKWEKNIARKDRSVLISMREVLKVFDDNPVSFSRYGTITFGAGITLQRKGGDNGEESANDLQFKMRTWSFLKALGRV